MANRIVVNNPLGREREVPVDKSIRFEVGGNIFRVILDEKECGIRINKLGPGKMRGKVDVICIIPEGSYQFLIK